MAFINNKKFAEIRNAAKNGDEKALKVLQAMRKMQPQADIDRLVEDYYAIPAPAVEETPETPAVADDLRLDDASVVDSVISSDIADSDGDVTTITYNLDDITKDLMKQLNQKNMLSGLNANQISLIEDMVSREVSASLQESNTTVNIDALQEQLKMAEQNLQKAQNNGNSNQSDIESTKKALADTKDLLTDANAALNKAIQESDEKNAKDLENSKKELKEEIAKNLADAMEKDNDILKRLAENTAQIQNTINQNTNITNITNMLGGHSIVTVTQEQYNSMTRDPNTIYFITN